MVKIEYENKDLYLILNKNHFYLTENEIGKIIKNIKDKSLFSCKLSDTIYDYLSEDEPEILEKLNWKTLDKIIKEKIYKDYVN